jgi:hypothetical protein
MYDVDVRARIGMCVCNWGPQRTAVNLTFFFFLF